MTRRGQDTEARLARWRQGTCPIHGLGLVTPEGEAPPPPPPDRRRRAPIVPSRGAVVACPHEECELRAAQWPGKDQHHALFGWLSGPEDIKAMLVKANEVDADNAQPGKSARQVRVSYQLEEDEH